MKKCFLLLILIICSCEKDDVCSENAPTTPRLVIEFYDITAPEKTKIVPGLKAFGIDETNEIVEIINETVLNRTILTVPLDINNTQTQFKLYERYDLKDAVVNGNPDIITITYNIEKVYISKACGYSNNFEILTFSITEDSSLWMDNSEIILNQITNENDIHVKIFH
ncbi:DUF6452 family protein [Flavobacteriaceae bacterium]|jgi:hypothetical protein|nr:DUF6452 family protein [Flavobacteriaceae bacterium]MDG1394827.1 DUF6452 family protein [Flavobacteriaceae bacterium]